MYAARRTIHFGDCDPAGIAFYPSYLRILDTVVEEFFASLGAPRRHMIEQMRIGTPTLKLELEFAHPGFHGDIMEFELRVLAIGRSSLRLSHRVSAGGKLLWSAAHLLVATSLDEHRSCPWPDSIRDALAAHLEKAAET